MSEKYKFSLGGETPSHRHAYRAHVRGIGVRVDNDPDLYQLADISATGCSFQTPQVICREDDLLVLQLEVRQRPILSGLEARVVRIINDQLVACSFEQLSPKQEYALDKLVLEIQKRAIAMRKI